MALTKEYLGAILLDGPSQSQCMKNLSSDPGALLHSISETRSSEMK